MDSGRPGRVLSGKNCISDKDGGTICEKSLSQEVRSLGVLFRVEEFRISMNLLS